MQWAIATAWGGHLIGASECTREDYYGIIFRCPECNEVVYWKEEFRRIRQNKEHIVSSHFAHHHTYSELVQQCDKRVNKYTEAERQSLNRNLCRQRIKLLQRYFWSIFCQYFQRGVTTEKIEEILRERLNYTPISFHNDPALFWNRMIETCKESIKDSHSKSVFQLNIDNSVNILFTDEVPSYYSSEDIEARKARLDFRTNLNKDLHRLICHEIFDFLCTRSASPILENMIIVYYIYAKNRDTDSIKEVLQSVCGQISIFGTYVPWTDVFAELRKEASKT